jgi:hypothetical protein
MRLPIFNFQFSIFNCLQAVALFAFAAEASAANTGEIVGRVEGAYVKSATAVHRATRKRTAGTVDRQAGEFTIGGLALDEPYDVVLDFDGGPRLEGVDLSVPPSDYEEEQPLTDEDVADITGRLRGLNKFEDVIDVLALQGNIQHAVVLLNKLRTRPFYNSQPGEVVWRAELWHFERPDESWVKVQEELFVVLYRERMQEKTYRAKCLTFDPALGGLRPTAESPRIDLGTIPPPETEPGIRLRGANKPTPLPIEQRDDDEVR